MAPLLDGSVAIEDPEGVALAKEVRTLIGMLDGPMRQSVLKMRQEELAGLAASSGSSEDDVMFARLFDTYSKSGIATLRCARYALTRLSDFGDVHRVSNRSYTYSEGFVAAFLSSQAAPYIDTSRLLARQYPPSLLFGRFGACLSSLLLLLSPTAWAAVCARSPPRVPVSSPFPLWPLHSACLSSRKSTLPAPSRPLAVLISKFLSSLHLFPL